MICAVWLAVRTWSGWGQISTALGWLFKHPMAALALVLAIWGWTGHRAADKWQKQAIEAARTLTAERNAAQASQLAAKVQSNKDAAHADTNHTVLAAGGAGRFAAYAAGHGLRQNPAHRPGPIQADPAPLPEIPAPDAIMADISRVWITRADWLTCDADWAYAKSAYSWAQNVGE
jgi:hypothetical protein